MKSRQSSGAHSELFLRRRSTPNGIQGWEPTPNYDLDVLCLTRCVYCQTTIQEEKALPDPRRVPRNESHSPRLPVHAYMIENGAGVSLRLSTGPLDYGAFHGGDPKFLKGANDLFDYDGKERSPGICSRNDDATRTCQELPQRGRHAGEIIGGGCCDESSSPLLSSVLVASLDSPTADRSNQPEPHCGRD